MPPVKELKMYVNDICSLPTKNLLVHFLLINSKIIHTLADRNIQRIAKILGRENVPFDCV